MSAVLALAAPVRASGAAPDRLSAGEELAVGESLSAGSSRFVMQADGNAVIYGPKGAGFATRTRSSDPRARLVMRANGDAAIYVSGLGQWHTGTLGNPGASLVLQADGNLVVYSSSGVALWSAVTGLLRPPAPPASSTLSAGGTLPAGSQLESGGNRLAMQTDGNLVVYGADNRPLFSTRTASGPGSRLVLQGDGNAVVYSAGGQALFATGTAGGAGNRMVIQADGNLVVYSASGAALWSSRSAGPAPRGYAFCELLNSRFPHGVGLPGAVDEVTGEFGPPVSTFDVDTAVYDLNSHNDRDFDGVACEKP